MFDLEVSAKRWKFEEELKLSGNVISREYKNKPKNNNKEGHRENVFDFKLLVQGFI